VTTRDTSLEALAKIKASGLLPARQQQVLEILADQGPMTAHEVVEAAREHFPKANQTSFNARLSELERKGVVRCLEKKKAHPVSGMDCHLWEMTGTLPLPYRQTTPRHWFLCVLPALYVDFHEYRVFHEEQEYEASQWAKEKGAELVEVREVR